MYTAELTSLLSAWSVWMRAASMSERTIAGRTGLVELVGRRTGCNPITLGWQPLAEFLADVPGPGSRQTYLADLRQWFRWLQLMGHRVDNPTEMLHKPRVPRRRPKPCTTEQLSRLLSSGVYAKTRTMILLAAYQGMRAHEIAKVRGDHVRGDRLRIVGKGRVDVEMDLHPAIAAEAKHYPRIGWWFPSFTYPGEPIRAHSVSATLCEAFKRAGIPGSAHTLRHWHGTQALKAAGGNLRVAQEMLRHASPATTAIYTLVDDEERRTALLGLPSVVYRAGGRRSG